MSENVQQSMPAVKMSDLERNWRQLLLFMELLCHKLDIDPDTTDVRVTANKLGEDSRDLVSLNLGDVMREGAYIMRGLP